LKKGSARGTEAIGDRSGTKPGRGIGDPLDRSHRFDRQESKERSSKPQAGKCGKCFAEVEAAQAEPGDPVAEQRIEERC
jgi:hypothetical protein